MHLTGVPAFVTGASPQGVVYLDALAARDLSRHTYIARAVRVVCPIMEVAEPPPGTVAFKQEGFEFVALPHATSLLRYLVGGGWLRAVWTMWRQLGWADVAFMGCVEYPIPYGWTGVPFAALRRVPWYTFIESTPWRTPSGVDPNWRQRLRATVAERINRVLFRRTRFAFVSHAAYAEFLRPGCPYLVSPAAWFLRTEIATPDQITAARAEAAGHVPHLMYIGRLDPAKGVRTLLSALAIVDQSGVELKCTVMGVGQLQAVVEHAAASLHHVRLAVATPLRYGPEFFHALRGVDALIVPNLGDEQSRNVFDAFSQGVPVLASNTPGLRSVVTDGVEGRLIPPGDVGALSRAIAEFADPTERARWIAYGDAGYQRVKTYDHDAMHAQRAEFIAALGDSATLATP
ncbi:MAG: glycosyltransferase [Actinomycetia bacterium]|nr:glycosyltransferase [Actinomycetes bacterium]